MRNPKLWISFHHQDEEIDHWALYLDTEDEAHCDVWQASGQTFEYRPSHLRGLRPDNVANFKEKWLMKDNLTRDELRIVRDVADAHPVDNEGAYWDCRVFCFEILAELEIKDVLSRNNVNYRVVRRRLHEKWMLDDGVAHRDSEDSNLEEDQDEDEVVDQTQILSSEIVGDSSNSDVDDDGGNGGAGVNPESTTRTM